MLWLLFVSAYFHPSRILYDGSIHLLNRDLKSIIFITNYRWNLRIFCFNALIILLSKDKILKVQTTCQQTFLSSHCLFLILFSDLFQQIYCLNTTQKKCQPGRMEREQIFDKNLFKRKWRVEWKNIVGRWWEDV